MWRKHDLLEELRRSDLYSPDFPKRRRLTHAQWAMLSAEERTAARSPSSSAIRRARNFAELRDLVHQIGNTKDERAVPDLASLWSDCALVPVRVEAGHALRRIGTHAARAALEALIEDHDHHSVFLAVRAIFDAGAQEAFARFAPYFELARIARPGGAVIPAAVLRTFCDSGAGAKELPWAEPRAPAWFMEDRRWMDLCVRLRQHPLLGGTARDALHHADPERVKAALTEARKHERPRLVRTRSQACGDLVTRYRLGEHAAVWSELRWHDAIDGDYREEALAVAAETMTRVAACVDLAAERLRSHGWISLLGELRSQPSAEDAAVMADIEQITQAPLPPSLRAFWQIVGGVDFVWNYEKDDRAPDFGLGLAMAEMDPLSVLPARSMRGIFAEWEERRSKIDPELSDPFNLDLAPDRLHKANISGGAPYGIELPFLGADPVFVNEEHGLPFVDYLRLCFRWGGFPRLKRHASRVEARCLVADMTRGMEPF